MSRSRRARRRFAKHHERRSPANGDGGALLPLSESDPTPLQVDPSAAKNAAPVPAVAPVPGNSTLVPLPPTAPGASSSETPSETSAADQVEIPTSLSTIIPATCAVIGVIVFAFVLWNIWLRKQKRKAKKAVIALYAPSPNYDAETLKLSTKHLLEPITPVSPSGSFGLPSSPKDVRPMVARSRSSTPKEKYAFEMPTPPPPATPATPKRFSIFGQVRAMPEFKDRDAKPVRSYSTRSASLLSSRMSTRRKPNHVNAPPASELPMLRITDCDSPIESSLPLPGLAGKLVSVIQAFESTMPDELPVAIGETLRVIEVYDDDWCLAERIGRKKGRGVLPQGCVTEKQLVEPRKRFSMLMLK